MQIERLEEENEKLKLENELRPIYKNDYSLEKQSPKIILHFPNKTESEEYDNVSSIDGNSKKNEETSFSTIMQIEKLKNENETLKEQFDTIM